VSELRRLLHLLGESEEQQARHLWWSRFRRRHQAGAKRAHMAWRAAQRPLAALQPSSAQQVMGLRPLSDEQWEGLQHLFAVPPHTPGRHEADYRLIVEGILWLIRTGSAWRSLPTRFGAWSKVLYYYRQWKADGRWARVLQALQGQEVPLRSSACLSVTVVLEPVRDSSCNVLSTVLLEAEQTPGG
jgi:transposase